MAEDTRLPRKVVIKRLLPKLASDADARKRFLREADALASVNHSGIVTIHDVGEYQGEPFIVMEYVEGTTLRCLIDQNQLLLERSLELALEIGEALSRAHEKGVVHRDLKPENIVLNVDGRVKLIDFGLAKLKGAAKLTKSGVTAGTFAYMSPEQTRGEDIDARSDIFSFGIVLYEMLASRQPFEGEYDEAVKYSIQFEPPVPANRFNSRVCPELNDLLTRTLAKKPLERYQTMKEVLQDLHRIRGQLGGKQIQARDQSHMWEPNNSIAVLYFENHSSEPDSEYFSDGMTEDIINDLSKIEGLRVASRNAVLPYKNKPVDIRVLCQNLNLEAVVQGTVRRQGTDVRIMAGLVDANNFNRWSERFDRKMEHIFELQEEIAKKIALALKVELLEKDRVNLSRKYKGDEFAYDRYLRGRDHYYKFTKPDLRIAVQKFMDALEIDPNYALAYAGVADSYMALVDRGFETDRAEIKQLLKKGEEAAQKALDIDPHCPEAHKALGTIYYKLWRFNQSRRHLLRALELQPRLAVARANLASTHLYLGNFEQAEREYRLAREQDSSLTFVSWLLARFYLSLNRFSEARRQIKSVMDLEESAGVQQIARFILSRIHFFQGEFEKALEPLRRYSQLDPDDPAGTSGLASLYAALGRGDEARQMLKQTLKKSPWDEDIIENLILTHYFLGEEESVYEWIRKGTREHKLLWVFLEYNPLLEKLRPTEKFQELLQAVKTKTLAGD